MATGTGMSTRMIMGTSTRMGTRIIMGTSTRMGTVTGTISTGTATQRRRSEGDGVRPCGSDPVYEGRR